MIYYQVYKAVILESQKEVAVKVMHPNIQGKIEIDLEIVKGFGSLLEYLPGVEYLGPRKEVDSFCEMMLTQLDLRVEADNLEQFSINFVNLKDLVFPTPIKKYCTKNVLVESFHEGILLKEWLLRGSSPFDSQIATIGLNGFMVIFQD